VRALPACAAPVKRQHCRPSVSQNRAALKVVNSEIDHDIDLTRVGVALDVGDKASSGRTLWNRDWIS
jgi:hypothetical protein